MLTITMMPMMIEAIMVTIVWVTAENNKWPGLQAELLKRSEVPWALGRQEGCGVEASRPKVI